VLVDYHNITPAVHFARWEPALAGNLAKGRRQLGALEPRASLGMADSAFNARELDELGYVRTAVVPILLDVASFEAHEPDPMVRRLDAVTWLFVGRLAPNKAQHDVVKAFAAYRKLYDPTARLRLVGGSSSHRYENTLREFVAGLGLESAVEIADVLVVCSEHEGFLVPLLEAMHHRLPIVAYAAAAVPETVDDAGLLLNVKDPCTVATAVHRVVSDDRLRAQLVDAGTRRVRDFDIARSRRKLLDAVEPVVEQPA